MRLDEYRRKRNFAETPEPVGRARHAGRSRTFVVQKHRARSLHYDFRLEINGVLVSWAVPKGPSMNPADKRLAVRTEDHPLEYADFEGVIPPGQYGAGTVMVWDKGSYEPKDGVPPSEQLPRGKIDVILHGQKLRGGFTLVRTGMGPANRRTPESWLLIKHRDQHAEPSWDVESSELDRSVLTGRRLGDLERSGVRAAFFSPRARAGARTPRSRAAASRPRSRSAGSGPAARMRREAARPRADRASRARRGAGGKLPPKRARTWRIGSRRVP